VSQNINNMSTYVKENSR